ncbi:MAG: UDP-N-acetylmuramoyl-tripeptide--D-alanyl-D-alanine ligase [Saprospiraceae bacterium]
MTSFASTDLLLSCFQTAGRVTTDTRQLQAGDLYFALKGDRFDGNQFVAQAIAQGASFAVTDDPALATHERVLLVEDTLLALQQLATAWRRLFNIPLLAITGSNGKTTTKELVASVLSKAHKTHFTQGNLNNHIGVPLTLLAMPRDTEIAVIEMGANHQREIAMLCRIAEPTHGLITNIGKAHLEGFGGQEGIKIGKGELYEWLAASKGVAFINMEEPFLHDMATERKVEKRIGYKISDQPQLTIPYYEVQLRALFPTVTTAFLDHHGALHECESHLAGRHNLHNIITAIAVGKYFKVPTLQIIAAIGQYNPSNNRSQWLHKDGIAWFMDAYNANPSSMQVALLAFKQLPGDRKVVVLGDMLELGEEAAAEHEAIARLALEQAFEQVVLVGDLFSEIAARLGIDHFPSAAALTTNWDKNNWQGAQVMVKGSRGMKLETII